MRTFAVTILETRKRRLRLVAASADAAVAMLKRTHGRDVRIEGITALGGATKAAAVTALQTILGADFLDIEGGPADLRDWLGSAAMAAPGSRARFDEPLALAGLRLRFDGDAPDGLVVGSANCIPFLADLMQGTGFEGDALLQVLSLVPGACRAGVTLAGVRSRAVVLPWASVVSVSVMGGAQ